MPEGYFPNGGFSVLIKQKEWDWNNSLDITKGYEVGGGNLQVSLGLLHRREQYIIGSGDPRAIVDGGYRFPAGRPNAGQRALSAAAHVGATLRIPINHFEGNYACDERTLAELRGEDRVVFRYVNNPNGSVDDIAGICNATRNVVGLMPHPEHAVEEGFGPNTPRAMRSGTDGIGFFTSAIAAVVGAAA